MPTTRSETSRSKTSATGETTSTETTVGTTTTRDWSLTTPPETTSVSATSRSTLTKRTPPPSSGGDDIEKDVTVPRIDMDIPHKVSGPQSNTRVDSVPQITAVVLSQANKPTCELDVRSSHSSHRKRAAEVQARREIAKRELEVAQAKLKLAQAELMGVESDEDIENREEPYRRIQEVEEWLVQTEERVQRDHEKPIKAIQKETKKSDIQKLTTAIETLARTPEPTSTRPTELPDFSGASEEWLAFKRTYEETASSLSDTQNLARLRKALQGRAKEAVQSLLFTAEQPQEVMEGLKERFGRPGALALAELEKLKALPRVSENPSEICIFAGKIRNAVATIKALKKSQYLHSPESMKAITEKMPSSMKFRWFAYYRGRREEDVPELSLINEFLAIEADACGDFAPTEIQWETKRPHRPSAPPEVQWEPKRYIRKPVHVIQETTVQDNVRKVTCPVCNEEHHPIECSKFRAAGINEKWNIIKKARLCFKCLKSRHSRVNCKAPVCKKCGRWHHTIMHSDIPPVPAKESDKKPCYTVDHQYEENATEEKIASVHTMVEEGKAYLKMVPVDLYGSKGQARVLALLDEGSTVTLLDSAIAKKIGAEGKKETLTIETVGGQAIRKNSSQKISIKIKGAHRKDKRPITIRTIEDLKLSEQEVDTKTIERCQHLNDIKHQLVYNKEKPKLLIGQDNWGLIVTRKLKKGATKDPVASLTSLGWVLHGQEIGTKAIVNFINHFTTRRDEIEDIVKRHFEIESLGIQARLPQKDYDRRALEILEETTKRLPNGHFETGLLWKTKDETLPNNYSQGLRRLAAVERKLDQNEQLKESYKQQIASLISNGYAEEAPDVSSKRTFYLPHFAVEHPVKKKPRIVFDAAAKYEGKSLNDALLPGPDLLQSLFGVLLRFREGQIAVMADIQDMFLRIKIREADRDSLRFLWRGDERKGKPNEYRMSSVIFGAKSSPATAIFVMNKNAEAFQKSHPMAVKAIQRNHYMDDYLQSFTTEREAIETSRQVKEIHEKAGFNLKGWASNNEKILEGCQEINKEKSPEIAKEEKTLGLRWVIDEDALAFNLGLRNTPNDIKNGKRIPTKREVTSAVMSTFDPMGLATPVLIQGKKLIQDIWRTKIDWDDKILDAQIDAWMKYVADVSQLMNLRVPRCISPFSKKGQLHTFTDASEEAYAASVYWRTEGPGGTVKITLVSGKARVTPTKPVSIPRLELQAALLGSRLAATIQKETDLEITNRIFWTDSSTVLQWVKSDPRKFKAFVAHRLAEIEDLTAPQEWRWVPTKENPADDATRGTPNDFDHTSRWFQGPTFLRYNEAQWPSKRFERHTEEVDLKKTHQITATKTHEEETPRFDRYSSWLKLLRTMTRVFQFIDLLRTAKAERVSAVKENDKTWKPQNIRIKKSVAVEPCGVKTNGHYTPFTETHEQRAEEYIIKRSQRESFAKEMKQIIEGKPLENSSRLKKIDVYISSNDMLKLRSRTRKFAHEARKTNPVVLDGKHRVTQLIIEYYHKRFLHGNTATVMNEIRQTYWILGLRAAVKSVIYRCQWCKLRKSAPQIPPTGDLPAERLQHHQPPFSHSAVDYFGPMHVTVGRRKEKRWGALFTCLTTRAVHLELVPSLSTSSMIMALRRMAARRGTPKVLFSDNGTNFVGANRELEEAALNKGIRWKFIPPGSPNMGGAWERLVRSVKTALAIVLEERSPQEEVLHTLMTEVEHIVNSRPLTHLSADPEDEEGLTPNHFLIGRSCGAPAPGETHARDLAGRTSWRTVQALADHFWKRWITEYLPTLMPRKITGRETTDPVEGDVVLIVDATLPRYSWPRGKVLKVYAGPDGRTRILDVQTSGGILRRPSRRVVILVPAKSSLPQDGVSSTAGEIVSDA